MRDSFVYRQYIAIKTISTEISPPGDPRTGGHMFDFRGKSGESTAKAGLLQSIITSVATALVFAVPLFFLPITTEFYLFNKFVLIVLAAAVMLFLWTLSFVLRKKVRITLSPFTLPILGFVIVTLIATFVADPSKTDAMYGQTSLIVALTVIFFAMSSTVKSEKILNRIFFALEIAGLLVVVFALISFTGLGNVIYPVEFMKNDWWSPMGAPMNLLLFLLPLFPLSLMRGLKKKQVPSLVIAVVLLIGIVVSGIQLLPGKDTSPSFLPQKAGWDVALEVFKDSPFLGTGPEGYNEAFTRFRPASLNANENLWAVRFGQSSNTYLHLLTTTGLLGAGAFVLLVIQLIKYAGAQLLSSEKRGSATAPISVSLMVILALMLLVPPSIVLFFLFFVLLALFVVYLKLAGHHKISDAVLSLAAMRTIAPDATDSQVSGQVLPWVFFLPSAALVIATLWFGGRAYAAEVVFRNALISVRDNQGGTAYNDLIRAINLNPRIERYHRTYSQVNLALANAIAGKEGELTEKDRSDIAQLIQQAIRESKNAAALNPTNVSNWENLAQTYRQLIGIAQNAEQWTIATYVQAIQLDPTNPNLRIQLGGVFLILGDFPRAQTQFAQAVALKPDHANAHYNLASAYKQQNNIVGAVREMEATLGLVDTDSDDYLRAQAELQDLRSQLTELQQQQLEAQRQAGGGELQSPQPLPTPIIQPPIELPQDNAPNIPAGQQEATPPGVPAQRGQ